jgi:hypothetical protein
LIALIKLNIVFIFITDRGVEQLVARRAHNPKVAGSSPAPATKELTRSAVLSGIYGFFISEGNSKLRKFW